MKLELGKMYNTRDIIKEYMPCNIQIGTCYVWKKYDYLHRGPDDGERYLLQPLLNNMFRVHNIYNINKKVSRK